MDELKELRKIKRRAYYLKNKERELENNRKWVKNNPEKRKNISLRAQLKRLYDITPEEYNELVAAQDGKCGICEKQTKLHVDHCHKTKRVRMLLCNKCNTGIGLFNESVDILQRAIKYVELHNE